MRSIVANRYGRGGPRWRFPIFLTCAYDAEREDSVRREVGARMGLATAGIADVDQIVLLRPVGHLLKR